MLVKQNPWQATINSGWIQPLIVYNHIFSYACIKMTRYFPMSTVGFGRHKACSLIGSTAKCRGPLGEAFGPLYHFNSVCYKVFLLLQYAFRAASAMGVIEVPIHLRNYSFL